MTIEEAQDDIVRLVRLMPRRDLVVHPSDARPLGILSKIVIIDVLDYAIN